MKMHVLEAAIPETEWVNGCGAPEGEFKRLPWYLILSRRSLSDYEFQREVFHLVRLHGAKTVRGALKAAEIPISSEERGAFFEALRQPAAAGARGSK